MTQQVSFAEYLIFFDLLAKLQDNVMSPIMYCDIIMHWSIIVTYMQCFMAIEVVKPLRNGGDCDEKDFTIKNYMWPQN